MNTTTESIHPLRESAFKWAAGGSMMEAIGALATMALAIVGLAGVLSMTLAAIATIVLGAAILVQSGAFGAGSFTSSAGVSSESFAAGGLGAEFLGGVAALVLGILALLGVAQMTLLSVALIVFGASFLFSNGSRLTFSRNSSHLEAGTGGGNMMIGLGAIVLGILAVIGTAQPTLILVGLLSLGAAGLFSGSSLGMRSYSAITH